MLAFYFCFPSDGTSCCALNSDSPFLFFFFHFVFLLALSNSDKNSTKELNN